MLLLAAPPYTVGQYSKLPLEAKKNEKNAFHIEEQTNPPIQFCSAPNCTAFRAQFSHEQWSFICLNWILSWILQWSKETTSRSLKQSKICSQFSWITLTGVWWKMPMLALNLFHFPFFFKIIFLQYSNTPKELPVLPMVLIEPGQMLVWLHTHPQLYEILPTAFWVTSTVTVEHLIPVLTKFWSQTQGIGHSSNCCFLTQVFFVNTAQLLKEISGCFSYSITGRDFYFRPSEPGNQKPSTPATFVLLPL